MPADQALVIALGTGGINLRDQPSQLGQGELTDSLNWQLDQNRALVKRLGYQEWADALPADALEVFSYEPSGGTIKQLAHAANGHVYWTTDGIAWTSIDSGLSISQPAIFIQYLDKVYWCDGVAAWRQWDGAVLTLLPTTDANDVQTVSLTGVPTGGTFKLGLNGELSANLNWNATAGDVQTALQGLTGIGPGNVICTGGPLPGTPIVCTFVAAKGFRLVATLTSTNALTGGTAPAVVVTHTTLGHALVPPALIAAIWRNRLWLAAGRRVYWSKAGDPTDYTTKTNFVDFPDGTALTGLAAAANVGVGADGADGVLVFAADAMHRITDDSDNLLGVVTGGASVLVDGGQGCVSQRSIAQNRGRVYVLGRDGVYSTDGHAPLRNESRKLGPLFAQITPSRYPFCLGLAWRDRYLLSFALPGAITNSRVLELNLDLPADGEGQHPWMAHSIPAAAWTVAHAAGGAALYFADSSPNDGVYVRQMFKGGYDVDSDANQLPVIARARSGAELLGVNSKKRVRRVEMYGSGRIALSISSDFESSAGETAIFDMTGSESRWNEGFWNEGVWGPDSASKPAIAYYTKAGRFITFEVVESSTTSLSRPAKLGFASGEVGGAAMYAMNLLITPLLS